jgi:hypothetical protein
MILDMNSMNGKMRMLRVIPIHLHSTPLYKLVTLLIITQQTNIQIGRGPMKRIRIIGSKGKTL